MAYPCRIVCLSEETTETLYLLGQQHRIVGISGYTVRPPEARRDKPKVSAFTSARIDRIVGLRPDLVLTFSDLQAGIVADLVRHGLQVHAFNQRDVAGILAMIRLLGAMVGAADAAERLADRLSAGIERVRLRAGGGSRPRVFFEEWDEPLISGIGWVSELIRLAGGEDCFADLATNALARDRVVTPQAVCERRPDIVIGSWCGKRFRPERVAARPGWDRLPAVADGHLYEVKSSLILQPGPAALTDGLAALEEIIGQWRSASVRPVALRTPSTLSCAS
jgi:iron complex transport system substrate-binding protein